MDLWVRSDVFQFLNTNTFIPANVAGITSIFMKLKERKNESNAIKYD